MEARSVLTASLGAFSAKDRQTQTGSQADARSLESPAAGVSYGERIGELARLLNWSSVCPLLTRSFSRRNRRWRFAHPRPRSSRLCRRRLTILLVAVALAVALAVLAAGWIMRRRRARAFKQAYPVQPGPQPTQGQQQQSQYGQAPYGSSQGVPMAAYPPNGWQGNGQAEQGQAPPGCESPPHRSSNGQSGER